MHACAPASQPARTCTQDAANPCPWLCAQAEYEREEIDWSYIEFVDNQDVLDLIEGKTGVLDLLDEVCRCVRAGQVGGHLGVCMYVWTGLDCTAPKWLGASVWLCSAMVPHHFPNGSGPGREATMSSEGAKNMGMNMQVRGRQGQGLCREALLQHLVQGQQAL